METMESKQLEIHKRYLKMAFIWATNSKATRLKVGALLVKNNAIISDGYNGTLSGMTNCCERPVDENGNRVVVILQGAGTGWDWMMRPDDNGAYR